MAETEPVQDQIFIPNERIDTDLHWYFTNALGITDLEGLKQRVPKSSVEELAQEYQTGAQGEIVQQYLKMNAYTFYQQCVSHAYNTRHTALSLFPEDILHYLTEAAHESLKKHNPDGAVELNARVARTFKTNVTRALLHATPLDKPRFQTTQDYLDLRAFTDNTSVFSDEDYPFYMLSYEKQMDRACVLAEMIQCGDVPNNVKQFADNPDAIARIFSLYEYVDVDIEEIDQDMPLQHVLQAELRGDLHEQLIHLAHLPQYDTYIFSRHELMMRLYYGIGGRGCNMQQIMYEVDRMRHILQEWESDHTQIPREQWGEIDYFLNKFNLDELTQTKIQKILTQLNAAQSIVDSIGNSTEDELQNQETQLIKRILNEDYSALTEAETVLLTLGNGIRGTTISQRKIGQLFGSGSPHRVQEIAAVLSKLPAKTLTTRERQLPPPVVSYFPHISPTKPTTPGTISHRMTYKEYELLKKKYLKSGSE